MIRSFTNLLFMLLVSGGTFAQQGMDQPDRRPSEPSAAPALEELPGHGEVRETGELGVHLVRALLVAPRTARLSSEIQGRIVSLPLAMGDDFSRDDLLVAFDCQRQHAELAVTKAELSRASKNLESKRSLLALDAVSELDVALAESEVEMTEARLKGVKAQLRNCEIHAPYDGRLVTVAANEFEVVAAGTPLLEIVESGKLRLEALVPSRWLQWLEEGYSFTVDVDELGQSVKAKIEALGGRVDPVSQTVAIRARIIDELPGLRPGMSGDARFKVPE